MMIEEGLNKVIEEVELWSSNHEKVEELKKMDFKIRHERLNELLQEGRMR